MADLAEFFERHGIPLWGCCRPGPDTFSMPSPAAGFNAAVVFGFPLSNAVVESLAGGPTPLYLHHYRQVNYLLDRTALLLAARLEAGGRRALPVPASQIVDWQAQRGLFCHRRAAVAAGLGWRGRNNLLVTPAHGSRVRLASVLTDEPSPAKAAAPSAGAGCGACRWCASRCPAGAIGPEPGDFDAGACRRWIRQACRAASISQDICGLCLCAGPGAG